MHGLGTIINVSMIIAGSLLGLNLIWPGKIRVANILPSIFIAMALSFIPAFA